LAAAQKLLLISSRALARGVLLTSEFWLLGRFPTLVH
jgi:hypothetical protein